jgi:uncharacterized protein DUF5995
MEGGEGMATDPIDQVLAEMDEIVSWCTANDSRAGYFAALYRRVTRTVRSRIGTGYFEDDQRMETLDVTFATRYLTAFKQWRTSDPSISACWQVAFNAVADPTLIILQNLLAGMNAHIDYDLGIASAQVAGTMEGLESLHNDFDKINDLLACLVPTVFTELGELSPLIHLVEDVDEPGEEKLVDLVMDVARDFAWLLANELVILRDAPDLQQKLLGLKDQELTWIGNKVVKPGGLVEKVVHVVWIPESKNVQKNIEALATPEMLPASCG